MNGSKYLEALSARLQADGNTITSEQLPGGPALVGYRSRFNLLWMATKLHVFTVAAAVPVVDGVTLKRFCNDALDLADARRGSLRGLQNGVAVIGVLAGDHVSPDAAHVATDDIITRFALFAWPAAVDLSTGTRYSHRGRVVLGGIYARYLRERTAVALG